MAWSAYSEVFVLALQRHNRAHTVRFELQLGGLLWGLGLRGWDLVFSGLGLGIGVGVWGLEF